MKDDSGLPNDCGLIAAVAWQFLTDRGVKSRIMSIRTGTLAGHAVVFFEAAGRLRAYDWRGTLVFNSGATWKTKPMVLAKAWAKAEHVPDKVLAARWR